VGIRCINARCITREPSERRHLAPKFWIVDEDRCTLRCVYCDFEREPKIVSRASTKKYSHDLHEWREILERSPHDLVLFSNEQEAIDAGHQQRRTKKRPSSSHARSNSQTPPASPQVIHEIS
jgi:hypothetical protein